MDEVCPSCGKWTEALNEESGWCAECDPLPTQDNQSDEWLLKYADQIEAFMFVGHGFSRAKRLVASANVPTCLCCRTPIKRGKSNHLFCTTTAPCRSAQRRYRTLRERYARQNSTASYEDCRLAAIQQIVREQEGTSENNSAYAK